MFIFKEKRVPVTDSSLNLLYKNMDNDPVYKELLTTPAIKIPRYRYLAGEVPRFLRDKTLLDIIKASYGSANFRSFFSVAGNKVTGFFAYGVFGDTINEIKTFSLIGSSNSVLAKDLIEFIKESLPIYKEIKWTAVKDNPTCVQYDKIIRRFHGTKNTLDDKTVEYAIPGQSQ
jgi:hypothetical protein